MSRVAIVVTMTGLSLALTASLGCGGRTIRLGGAASATDAAVSDVSTPRNDAAPDGAACQRGQVRANEVLWIGDSWVGVPNNIQRKRVQELARAASVIAVDDEYVDRSASGTKLSQIVGQYRAQQSGPTKVKVLIMDGGTWDLFLSGGASSTITEVVSQFRAFMNEVTSDGTVQHVIYFLVPELAAVPGIANLRPGLEQACRITNPELVPCHFLDLQTIWENHSDYTDPASNIQASEAGAMAIAEAIWKIMQDNCIAQ